MKAEQSRRESKVFDVLEAAIERPFGNLKGVGELTEALYDFDEIQALVENLCENPAGLRVLIDRASIRPAIEGLDRCAPGTLGAALRERNPNLPLPRMDVGTSKVHAYVVRHLIETAPLWLTVIGADEGDDGRLFLLGFYAAQIQPAGPFLALIAKNLCKVILERPDRVIEHMDTLVRGYLQGKRSQPLFGADWEMLIEKDLREVRARFGIYRGEVELASQLTRQNLASEVEDLSGIDREAFGSVFRELVAKPYGAFGFEAGVKLRDALITPPVMGAFGKQLLSDPEVVERANLRPLPRLGKIDFREFHELPPGSLGRTWGDQMLAKGFPPLDGIEGDDSDFSRYLNHHYNESHDIWHVLTGARTDKPGEIALLGFSAAQLPATPMLTIVARSILKTALQELEAASSHMDAVAAGWLLGRHCRSLVLVDWKPLLDQPVGDLRAHFEIFPGGLEDVDVG